MTCGIYMLHNSIENKFYIGQSVNIERRYEEHLICSRNYTGTPYSKLYSAICKFGEENFRAYKLQECSVEELNEREKYWIKYYDSYNNGYNMTIGGDNFETGEDNSNSSLTAEEAKEVKFLLKNSDKSLSEIANLFNCSPSNISLINSGKIWGWLENDKYNYPIKDTSFFYHSCNKCGSIISKGHELCVKCAGESQKGKNRGENPPSTKLTEEQVIIIKDLLKNSNKSQAEIAREFGVSRNTVWHISKGNSWSWLK